jgi:hypothetical protein
LLAVFAGALAAGAAVTFCCAAARLGANIGTAAASTVASQNASARELNFDPESLNGNPRRRLAERRGRPGRRDRLPKLEG